MTWHKILELDIKEKYSHSKFIIVGDFNSPGIDWEYSFLLTDTYTDRLLREKLLSFRSLSFQHEVATITLDLCFTSHPNIILNCSSIPGFSDHARCHISHFYCLSEEKPCRILLYRKADWDLMWSKLFDLSNEYLNLIE